MAEMKIDIRSDVHQAPEDIRGVNQALDVMEDKADEAGKKLKALGEKAERIGKKMSLMVTVPLLAAGGAAIKMAMDAEEGRNLFEVSMGGMTEAADEWAAHLSDAMGINRYEAQKTIGTFNVMLKSMEQGEKGSFDMAKGLSQLGYDMASFFNLEPEDAFLKLQSAIAGEAEPLKRLGIIVNDTTIKTWALNNGMIKQGEVLTEAQKVQARYNVILERTTLAQGDMARTLDSPANKLRILKSRVAETTIEFGMKMLPTFERMLSVLEKGVKWFGDMSDASKGLTIKIAVVAAAIGPMLFGFGKLILLAPKIKLAFTAMTGPVGILVTALAAAGAAIDYFLKKSIEASDAEMAAIAKRSGTHAEFHAMRKQLIKDEILTTEEWSEIFNKHGRNYARVMKAIATLPEYEELREHWKGMTETIDESVEEMINKIPLLEPPILMIIEGFKEMAETIKLELIPPIDEMLEKIEVAAEPYGDFSSDAGDFMNELIADTVKLGKSTGLSQEQMNKGTKFWAGEEKKELTGLESGIVGLMNVYEQGMEGILQSAKRWAIAEAVKYIMSRPMFFPIKLGMAIAAMAAISGVYSAIAKAEKGGILMEPTVIEAGHGRGEALIPLEKLPGVAKEITREMTIREPGGGVIHLSLYLGTELIADQLIDIIQDKAEKGEIEIPVKVML